MDAGTHALASVAITRVLVPRAPLAAYAVIVLAGTIADIDTLSAFSGPSAYLIWHHTYTHSLVASMAIGAILSVLYLVLGGEAAFAKLSRVAFLSTVFLAGFLHLAMDACQSDGIAAFWPFSARRVAADWLASVDPWIIVILVATLLLPELARLIGDEIGAKNKRPRGRNGAIVGLILVIVYVGARANFHADAIGAMQARTYRGDSARRTAAYAESASLFTWHGIVETDHALQELVIDTMPGAGFDPENGVMLFKPEPSPILDRAQNTDAAKQFLCVAQFPKASIEKTLEGYEVKIRDLRYAASGETRREIIALIKTDSNGKVLRDELVWEHDFRRH